MQASDEGNGLGPGADGGMGCRHRDEGNGLDCIGGDGEGNCASR